jgi:hypothetical protein
MFNVHLASTNIQIDPNKSSMNTTIAIHCLNLGRSNKTLKVAIVDYTVRPFYDGPKVPVES